MVQARKDQAQAEKHFAEAVRLTKTGWELPEGPERVAVHGQADREMVLYRQLKEPEPLGRWPDSIASDN